MKIGDRVRVKESVIVYHHPKHKAEGLDAKGMEGEIIDIIEKPVTANIPVKVQFDKKFIAHFRDDELEIT